MSLPALASRSLYRNLLLRQSSSTNPFICSATSARVLQSPSSSSTAKTSQHLRTFSRFREQSRPSTSISKVFASHPHTRAHVIIQARPLSSQTRTAIDKAVSSAPIVLFMKGTPETPQCGFSRASIQILGMQGVDPGKFAAYNVLEDEELRQGIKEYSDWPTIPQLYVDKEFVGGCDILVSMHQDGSLAKMLDSKGMVLAAEEAKEKKEEQA